VEQDEIVGYHLEQAFRYRSELGPADEAAMALRGAAGARLEAAGLRALELGDAPGAINLIKRALDLGADLRLELAHADALFQTGRTAEAAERCGVAAGRAEAAGDRITMFSAQIQRLYYLSHADPAGRFAETAELLERARPEIEASGDDGALAVLWGGIAWQHHATNRMREQAHCNIRAAEHAERAGARHLAAGFRHYAAAGIAVGPTRADEALEWLEAQSDVDGSLWYDEWRSGLIAGLGRFDEALALHRSCMDRARERGQALNEALFLQGEWTIHRLRGDHVRAEQAGRLGTEAMLAQGNLGWASSVGAMRALSLAEMGRFDEARAEAEIAIERGGVDDVWTLLLAEVALARVALGRGDVEQAEHVARRALARAEAMEVPDTLAEACLALGLVLRAAGRGEEAAAVLERGIAACQAKGNVALERILTACRSGVPLPSSAPPGP
jgi:tetratricopeptide (TPR) repeat protein